MKRSSSTSSESLTPSKKSRVLLNSSQKREVILMLNRGVSVVKTAEEWGISHTTVRSIKKRASEYLQVDDNLTPTTVPISDVIIPEPTITPQRNTPVQFMEDLVSVPEHPEEDVQQTTSAPEEYLTPHKQAPHTTPQENVPAPQYIKQEPVDPAPLYSIPDTLKAAEELFQQMTLRSSLAYSDRVRVSSLLSNLRKESGTPRSRQTSLQTFFKRT